MSYKENLIKLLQQEVKSTPPIAFQEGSLSSKAGNMYSTRNKSTSIKRKRKKSLKHNHNKHTKSNENAADTVVLPQNSHEDSFHKGRNLITNYSDSDVEINVSTSSENNWTNEIKTNITPSKSEYCKDMISENFDIDTIYHIGNNMTNNIFSSEESDSEYFEKFENLILSEFEGQAKKLQEKKILSFKSYDIQNGKIIILKDESDIYIHGSFNLSVIYGNLHLLGYELTPLSDNVEVHSLRGFSYFYVKNIHQGNYCLSDNIIRNELDKMGLGNNNITDILSKLKPTDTIMTCSSLKSLKVLYLEKHISQKLLPVVDGATLPIVIKSDVNDLNVFKLDLQWDKVVDKIDKLSKLMICGGKGVGKSMLMRYMINKLLKNFSGVLVIDLDPGQPEFTIPGCISAVIVQKPIFGPNFTHLQNPERCVFIGNIDVTLEPDIYIKNVIELLKQSECISEFPTLINYMGYSQSFGINIASSIITYVSPTILLQINSNQQSKNFAENLKSETIMQHLKMFGGAVDTSNLAYEFIALDSMCDGLTSWKAQGRTIREMCILSYFSQILDNSLSLTSKNVPLYKIFLKDINLVSHSEKISNELAIFNASLVSLCTLTHTNNIYNCHGWGIVRGIDQEKLVLITPVSEDILEKVTHLVIGSVTLPPSMLMYEDKNIGLIPYVSLGCISTFNYIPKRSYLPKKNN